MSRLLVLAILCAVVTSLAVTPSPAWADNLIVNGGFEELGGLGYDPHWPVVGWTSVASGSPSLQPTTYTEGVVGGSWWVQFNAHTGNYLVDMTGSGNEGPSLEIYQDISTVPGATYLVSFWVGNAYSGPGTTNYLGPAIVGLSINDGPNVPYTNSNRTPNYDNWQEFSTTFTATGSTTRIKFWNDTPKINSYGYQDNFAGLDDVSVTQAVPEPSSLVAWSGLCAMGLIVAWKRRKRAA